MYDSLRVAIGDTFKDLSDVVLNALLGQALFTDQVQVLRHIGVAILLDEIDVVVEHNCVFKSNNIVMFQLHKDGNLANGGGWNAIIFVVNVCLLDGVSLSSLPVNAFVDAAIGASS